MKETSISLRDILKSISTLYRESFYYCAEDNIIHLGRSLYSFYFQEYFNEKKDLNLIRLVKENFKLEENIPLIFPGSIKRRNYSTNAIDNGIFLDSICSNFTIEEIEELKLKPILDEIATNYCAKKIEGKMHVPNQILWSANGLSKWQKKYNINKYDNLLKKVIDNFFSAMDNSGQVDYSFNNSNKGLRGPSTYYHSRCIAFIFDILIDLGILKDFKKKIELLVLGLVRQYNHKGYKNLSIETKRYYFHQFYEIDSFPYDLYVFSIYSKNFDNSFDFLANRAFKFFIDNFSLERNGKFKNWQCNHVRLSHMAWICKIDKDYLDKISKISFTKKHTYNVPIAEKQTLIPLNVNGSIYHFLTKKAPLNLFSGGKESGILSVDLKVNNFFKLNYLDYQVLYLKKLPLLTIKELKHFIYHSIDWIFYKKDLKQFLYLFYYQFLGTIFFKSILRTSFANIINYKLENNQIKYSLVLSNFDGTYKEEIGYRTITIKPDKLKILDELFSKKHKKSEKHTVDLELTQRFI
ncbi:hypothetical protein N8699_00945 [Flavobacteriaceae bacterium]|nr:hypothetical protein [Flavobacteriaceae bacterium]